MKYVLFLKWWLFFTLVCVASVFVYYTGFFGHLWEKDASHLSWAILAIFAFFSILCGGNTFMLSRSSPKTKEDFEHYQRQEEMGWFISEFCLTLGMIGTIVGFVFMLSGFEGIDMSKPQTIQSLLSDLGKSMATALYTTLIGLICGSMLKIQYFNMSMELQRLGGHKEDDLTSTPIPKIVSQSNPFENFEGFSEDDMTVVGTSPVPIHVNAMGTVVDVGVEESEDEPIPEVKHENA